MGGGRAAIKAFALPPGTARLRLREFTAADVDTIYALDSDPRVMRFISDGSPSTREDAELTVGRVLRRYTEHPGQGAWHASRRDDGRFVGWASLKFAGESPDLEVGYRLVADAWGSGFATELARGCSTSSSQKARSDSRRGCFTFAPRGTLASEKAMPNAA